MRTTSWPTGTTLNDATVGGQAGFYGNRSNDGSGGDRMPGLIGLELELDDAGARKFAAALGLTVGVLKKGRYRRVKTKAGSTVTPARGLAAFYSSLTDEAADTVTPDMPTNPIFAGVYLGAVTAGNYTWIQVSGLAPAQFVASALTTTSAVGLPVQLVAASSAGRFDNVAIATSATLGHVIKVVGQQAEAAVADTISYVFLWETRRFL